LIHLIPSGTIRSLEHHSVAQRVDWRRHGRAWWIGIGLLTALAAAPASARIGGITGLSGKSGGLSCGNTGTPGCHVRDGGASTPETPVVRFAGPTQLDPGATATYRFVVDSQAPTIQTAAGFNVAASAGKLSVIDGQPERLASGELTHTGPQNNDQNGEAAWEFMWQAPSTAGVYVLFGAGNSVNADLMPTGDASAVTTLMIAVGDVPTTPTPTATPMPSPTSPSMCAGDCDRNGTVSVAELVSAVNIALGTAPVTGCSACDTNGDGMVSVGELVSAVNRALNGC
jgi:hypothetical protein